MEETGSNLLPRLSKDVTRVLRDVSYKLFDTIVYEPDVNRNIDINLNNSRTSNIFCERRTTQDTSKKNVTRSHTQPEICFRTNNINLNVNISFMTLKFFFTNNFAILEYF